MLNTFADVSNSDDNPDKTIIWTTTTSTNPFELTSTKDPFGVSTTMSLSQSSEKFDSQPFSMSTSNIERTPRCRSGKDALSSSNWLAYQHSMDEANLDLLDDSPHSSFSKISSTRMHSTNPFALSAETNVTHTVDDHQVDTNASTSSHIDQNQLFYDLLGLSAMHSDHSVNDSLLSTTVVLSSNETNGPSPTRADMSVHAQSLDWFNQSNSTIDQPSNTLKTFDSDIWSEPVDQQSSNHVIERMLTTNEYC
jgi:hypothetical protein